MSPVCNPQYSVSVGDVGQSDYTGYLPAHAANVVHLLIHGCLSVVVGTGDNWVNRFYRVTCTGCCLVVGSWSVRRGRPLGTFGAWLSAVLLSSPAPSPRKPGTCAQVNKGCLLHTWCPNDKIAQWDPKTSVGALDFAEQLPKQSFFMAQHGRYSEKRS